MTKYNGFKVAALAASIALAMGSTAAMAAAPAANQLPGQGHAATGVVAAGTATITTPGGVNTLTIPLLTDGVITWKNGTAVGDINPTGTAGFNVGSGAAVDFTGGANVLNVDSTGNASQIFGAITSDGSVFVANTNGIIVGATGSITAAGDVGLIANTLDAAPSFDGTVGGFVYNGTGGDVTVQRGATLDSGGDVFIAGGGNVNVDLGAVSATTIELTAGLPLAGSPFATKNAAATVTATGASGGTTIDSLSSAGTATTNGKVTIAAATDATVTGVLTNNGDLTLNGDAGNVHNQGQLASVTDVFTSLFNDGSYATSGAVNVNGGNLTNNGSITHAGVVTVSNGNINNSGSIADVTGLVTQSDSADAGFTAGGQYYINNSGTITSDTSGTLRIAANTGRGVDPTKNDSTGSFTNTGTLQLDTASALAVYAQNNVNLGGKLQVGTAGVFKDVSKTNPIGNYVDLYAGGDDGAGNFATGGVLTVSTPVFFDGTAGSFQGVGAQVKLMSSVFGLDPSDGSQAGYISIQAGAAVADDYAVRIASGQTLSANGVDVDGYGSTDNPNVILQGTISSNETDFGGSQAISDLFSGPGGSLVATGSVAHVHLTFTGSVKTAKYLNNADNFRYNYLPITNKGTDFALFLDPVAYATNGTSNGKSAVNILVNGDVELDNTLSTPAQASAATAVTGVTNWENTHLVLQSTGDIATNGDFYWPGYVYLGNIDSDTSGNALPGTLGAGSITLGGNFNNVLPGNIAGAGGIHFITAAAIVGNGYNVRTNANSWINLGTDLLTQNYAQGILTDPTFEGGTQGSGSVVNYGTLDPSMFHTHAPDATK